jgi:hypothetical protein
MKKSKSSGVHDVKLSYLAVESVGPLFRSAWWTPSAATLILASRSSKG